MEQNNKKPPSIAPEQHSLSENLALAIKDEGVRRRFSVKMKVRKVIPSIFQPQGTALRNAHSSAVSQIVKDRARRLISLPRTWSQC
jgi:hypothetical protein